MVDLWVFKNGAEFFFKVKIPTAYNVAYFFAFVYAVMQITNQQNTLFTGKHPELSLIISLCYIVTW
jgi:hypothetical protein